jgi:hypothetical protein
MRAKLKKSAEPGRRNGKPRSVKAEGHGQIHGEVLRKVLVRNRWAGRSMTMCVTRAAASTSMGVDAWVKGWQVEAAA